MNLRNNFRSGLIFLSILFSTLQTTVSAQEASEIFNNPNVEIIWLGVDFSQVMITGSIGSVSTDELIPLFEKINLLIINEKEKYNFRAALRKKEILFDLNKVNNINREIDIDKVVQFNSSPKSGRINEELISKLIKNYDSKISESIGLVIFMETMDKSTERGTMWVSFFNLSNHKLLFTEQMTGLAYGFGFRNHWAGTVYDVIEQIRRKKYKKWKAKYGK